MAQRIGLLTLPLHTNYGGILQAVALYQLLSEVQKKQVVFLEREAPDLVLPRRGVVIKMLRPLPGLFAFRRLLLRSASRARQPRLARLARLALNAVEDALRQQRIARHGSFKHRHLPLRSGPLTSTQQMIDAVRRFDIDTLVVGSDQVWRLDYVPPGAKEDFFFGFAPGPSVRKISYAASFGRGDWSYPEQTERVRELLAGFDAVSVREASGVQICLDVLGRDDAQHVLDPTLLIDPAFYEGIAAPARVRSGRQLLNYVLDEEPDRPAVSGEVLAALGPGYSTRTLMLDAGQKTPGVPDWLRAFMDADFVVTDSFHGVVFSIIFRKNFIAILNHGRGADRFVSLLGQLGLSDRLVSDPAAEKLRELARTPIDFGPVGERLEQLRAASADFLQRALG